VELAVAYEDGTSERIDLPVDVWRSNELRYRNGFFTDKKVIRVELDPDAAYADIDREDNVWEAPEVRSGENTNR
jgi:hypothetical protein